MINPLTYNYGHSTMIGPKVNITGIVCSTMIGPNVNITGIVRSTMIGSNVNITGIDDRFRPKILVG